MGDRCLPKILDYQAHKRATILATREKVKSHMKLQRVSVRALAKRSNIPYGVLHEFLKNGTDIKLSTISRLAAGFQLPMRELMP